MDPLVDRLPMCHERDCSRQVRLQIDRDFPQNRARLNSRHESGSHDLLILDTTDFPLQQAVAVGMVVGLLGDLLGAGDSYDSGGAGIPNPIDTGPVGAILGKAASVDPVQESFRVL